MISPRRSLAGKLTALGALPLAVAIAIAVGVQAWLDAPLLAASLAALVAIPLWAYSIRRGIAPAVSLFRALAGTAASYRDGDFSFSLRWDGKDELAELVAAHNDLGDALRDQRLTLVQRELLLDTMVQHTPVAMLLSDARDRVVYGNIAARRLLNGGARLEGLARSELVATCPEPMREAIERGGDGLFTVGGDKDQDGDEEVYHVALRRFRLNGVGHELLLIRHLTAELRRQEVGTWKKVIRVISHELNNSLGPIASLAQSGGELLRRGQPERLGPVFATIDERAEHLSAFIRGYAQFAKLPAPRLEAVPWARFLEQLRSQIAFSGELPPEDWVGHFDRGQLEQAVLNLVKNAHESGSPPGDVVVTLRRLPGWFRLEVADRGTGMPEAALASALVPFYSTKRSGTGLGLALAREIAEAHGGRIALGNRPGGGLSVTLTLPVIA